VRPFATASAEALLLPESGSLRGQAERAGAAAWHGVVRVIGEEGAALKVVLRYLASDPETIPS